MRVKVDLDGGSLESRLFGHGIGIHGIYVIGGIVHHDHLRISGFCSWGNVPPDKFRGDLSVVRFKMILEAWLSIDVGFPDHSRHFGMHFSISPVSVIIHIELSSCILDDSVGIVDA